MIKGPVLSVVQVCSHWHIDKAGTGYTHTRHTQAYTGTHTHILACTHARTRVSTHHTPTPPPSSFLLIHCGCWEGSRRRVQSHGGRLGMVDEGSPCGTVHHNFLPVGKLGCMSLFTRSIHLGEVLPCSLFLSLGLHFKSCFWGHSSYILFTWPNHCKRFLLSCSSIGSSPVFHTHTPSHQPPTCYVCIVEKEGDSPLYLVHITVFTYIRAYVHLLKGHPEMEHGLCM